MKTPEQARRLRARADHWDCECADPSCHVHRGDGCCPMEHGAKQILFPIGGIDDEVGVAFCDGCASYALHTELFQPATMVRGGQGRTEHEVRDCSGVLLTLLALALLFFSIYLGSLQ